MAPKALSAISVQHLFVECYAKARTLRHLDRTIFKIDRVR